MTIALNPQMELHITGDLRLFRELNVDAVLHQPISQPLGIRMGRGVVAGKALAGHGSEVPFRPVDVVAGGAGHRRAGRETLGLLQQRDLIAVDIGDDAVEQGRTLEEVAEQVTGLVGEWWLPDPEGAAMAHGAIVELLVSRGVSRVVDGLTGAVLAMGLVVLHVLAAVAVAFPAREAQLVVLGVPGSAVDGLDPERCAVALEAPGRKPGYYGIA